MSNPASFRPYKSLLLNFFHSHFALLKTQLNKEANNISKRALKHGCITKFPKVSHNARGKNYQPLVYYLTYHLSFLLICFSYHNVYLFIYLALGAG